MVVACPAVRVRILILLMVFAWPIQANAIDFYVNAAAPPGGNGLTPQQAFQTITLGALAIANPGDRVIVRPGIYREGNISPSRSGLDRFPVQLLADTSGELGSGSPGTVWVLPPLGTTTAFNIRGRTYVVVDGFTIVGGSDAGIQVKPGSAGEASQDITVTNNRVSASLKRGIDILAGGAIRVSGNLVASNGSSGISIDTSPYNGATVDISENTSNKNGSHGILVVGAKGGTVAGNDAEDNAAAGLRLRSVVKVSVDGNTCASNGADGIGMDSLPGGASSADNTITNNYVAGSSAAGILITGKGTFHVESNTITESITTGIAVQAGTSVPIIPTIVGNDIRQSGSNGLFIAGAHTGMVLGNSVSDSGGSGILVRTSSEMSLLGNTVIRSDDGGIKAGVSFLPSAAVTDVAVEDNSVEDTTGSAGVSIVANGKVSVTGNTVLRSETGAISATAQDTALVLTVSNNVLGVSGGHGIFVSGAAGQTIQNNLIFSHAATGVTLRGSPGVTLGNNLIYANGSDGIAVGTQDAASPNLRAVNNTVYGNGGWGLRLGSSQAASGGATVFDNIFQGNAAGGITVASASFCGYVAGYNLNLDGYGSGTPASPYDLASDPLFLDPAGPDGVLGGDGFGDDNFHLAQGGGGSTSPAVNAGATLGKELGITGSTSDDLTDDQGIVDLGFHYNAEPDQTIAAYTPYMPLFVRATQGADDNDGRSPNHALHSIRAAAQRAVAGVTVIVGPGHYSEGDIGPGAKSGKVTFLADPTGALTGDGHGAAWVDARGWETGFMLRDSCDADVEGFAVMGAMTAGIQIQVSSHRSQVRNNWVFSGNRRGVDVIDADDVAIVNNLVYANGTGGIQVGGVAGSQRAVVTNNTVYDNGGVGILVGASSPSTGADVRYNVIDGNGDYGIQVNSASLPSFVSGYNLNTNGYGSVAPRPPTDLHLPPEFTSPRGLDGVLGGEAFFDDDFHLSQVPGGQDLNSPAVDFAPITARAANMDRRTTRSDGFPDTGYLDLGYHYPATTVETIYVSPAGMDTNTGASADESLQTIGEAINRARPGQQIILAAGEYHESNLRPGSGVTISGPMDQSAMVMADGASTVFDVRDPDVSIAHVGISGATSAGVRVKADRFRLVGSRVFSNPNKGIFLAAGSDALILNNLVYKNQNSGIVIGDRPTAANDAIIAQNTIFGNANRGLTVGLSTDVPSLGAIIFQNIIAENSRVGIDVGADSAAETHSLYNSNSDGYSGISQSPTDITDDPELHDPPGPDGVIGGANAADDDFHLSAITSGQSQNSPCLNAGIARAASFGLERTSTRTDHRFDRGRLDLGYHYGPVNLRRALVGDRIKKILERLVVILGRRVG